jgi:hypothetical protein
MTQPSHAELFSKYRAGQDELVPIEGMFTNYFGLKTRASLFGHAANLDGLVFDEPPLGDDKVYGGAIEYASLLTAVDTRKTDETFSAVELGAGWGPWVSLAGVVCRRLGIAKTTLIAVEASRPKVLALKEHLAANQLLEQASIDVRVVHGAAWSEDTILYFPSEMPITDYGGGASQSASETDYRGMAYKTEPVDAFSLQSLAGHLPMVDYMHWDLQGAEADVAVWGREFLNERVRCLFIGTHSRRIEGRLTELFYRMGWDLISENPCAYRYDRSIPSLEGMTFSDGDMFWMNPRLS